MLLILSLWKPDAMGGVRGEATDVVAPVGEGSAVVRNGGQSLWEAILRLLAAPAARTPGLTREVKEAHVRLAEAKALEAENTRLKALLGLQGWRSSEAHNLCSARSGRVRRARGGSPIFPAGSDDGVKPGMPVRSPLGLVGRVLEVGDSSSRVLLLTDGASMVPVRRAKDDVVAFAEGAPTVRCASGSINLGINPLKKGDVFVTSGSGGIFRPGIAVAVVERLTRDGAIALPTANPAATVHVAVEPVWEPQADAVINRPAPAAQPDHHRGSRRGERLEPL